MKRTYPPSPIVTLASVKCRCGSDAVRIDPGEPAEISEAADILVRRGRDASGLCLACWPTVPAAAGRRSEARP